MAFLCPFRRRAQFDSTTKDGSAMTLTRLRGRSHFGAAKARPRQGACASS
jgi:hypothetical protein